MQVARNFFLTRKQTFSRKFNEILLALQIEKELTKGEILELYTNKIYLGNRAYGIEAAARVYYGQSIGELDLAQLAMIAGLPKAPSAYNPIANPQRAVIRRNWILGRMLSLGYIDKAQHTTAIAEPVTASYHGSRLELSAPYIAEMTRKEAVDKLGLAAYTDGFRIYTTIDSKLQEHAQQAVIDGLLSYDKRHGYRGPEAKLPMSMPKQAGAEGSDTQLIDPATDNVSAIDQNTAGDGSNTDNPTLPKPRLPLLEWQHALSDYRTVGGLTAAVVTQVNPDSVDFLTADGTQANIRWENGLSDAKPYISENRYGFPPKTASDVLETGDVIRIVKNQEGDWQLTQVPAAQAALVSLNPADGAINALVGGFDFSQSHFNRATQAERQPGSNFKPFVYTTALEHGFTPATTINDAPIVFDDPSLENTWRPENASGKFFGPTRLRQALYKSRNLVSIRVLRSIGIDTAIDGMDRFGFDKDKLPRNLSLALGTYSITPLQLATGYAVLANGGFKVSPYLIDRVDNVDGETVFQALPATVCRECEAKAKAAALAEASATDSHNGETAADNNTQADSVEALENAMAAELAASQQEDQDSQLSTEIDNQTLAASEPSQDTPAKDEPKELERPVAPRVVSEQVAYLIDDILRDVIQKGTGRRAKVLERDDLAGKTGTTNGPTDAWFSGYNRNIVTTAWLGFDQNTNLGRHEYGGTSALPIWIDFMRVALKDIPKEPRSLPDGLVSIRIDPNTGKRAQPNQRNAIFETFRVENVPGYGQGQAPDLGGGSGGRETLPEDLF